jgi:hypothetical protein
MHLNYSLVDWKSLLNPRWGPLTTECFAMEKWKSCPKNVKPIDTPLSEMNLLFALAPSTEIRNLKILGS